MFASKLFLILFFCVSFPIPYSYDVFVKIIEREFSKDAWIRPSDSLFYVPTVIWYKMRNYDKLNIEQRRQQLFYHLSSHRVRLAYHDVYDLINRKSYYNYSMDWLDNHRRRYMMNEYVEASIGIVDSIVFQKKQALIKYVIENAPDYMFTIETIDIIDGNYSLYWVIRNNTLYAVEYNIQNSTFIEYDAVEYLKYIAHDSVFDMLDYLIPDNNAVH